ncbi:MAG: hypothetical protein K6B46_03410 [Opitutales bacterium]|nr:hypothetical protein [Opitutales bacterium]
MKKIALLFAAAALLPCVPATGTDLGNIVFIGDSITQSDGTHAVSYRYSLWKNFVDNDVAYNPVGSMKNYFGGATSSALVTNYRGETFDNTNEGHFGWDAPWITTGTTDGRNGSTFPSGTTTTGKGLSDWIDTYYSALPDTATVLIGINDLSRNNDHRDFNNLLANQKAIVEVLQAKNANVTVHMFSLLPSGQGSWSNGLNPGTAPGEYNALLKSTVESGAWNTATSTVVYHDITTGFNPTNGVHTYDSLHPQAQGELILAGNIARALGVGQRTVGLERRAAANLSSQLNFGSASASKPTIKTSIAGVEKTFTTAASGITTNAAGNLVFNTAAAGGFDTRLVWSDLSVAQELTLSFSVKMTERNNQNNQFGIIVGNGAEAGLFYLRENGVYWNTTLLYGTAVGDPYESVSFTDDFNDFTIAWIDGSERGVSSGFYIWLGDQLIGEGLGAVGGVSTYKNTLLFGDIGSSQFADCELAAVSFELGAAYAPEALTIPEPSAFGWLAGTLALALAGTRRRRKK